MSKKLLSLLTLLLTMVTSAWAQSTYTINLKSEYTSVPTIYAGTQNYFMLNITNNKAEAVSNVIVELYLGEELIETQTIESLSAEQTGNLPFVDRTIRPITEKTIIGNDNDHVVYTVVVKENDETKERQDFSFVVLYNGNLGKEIYAYHTFNPLLRKYTFSGDVQILNGTDYCAANTEERDDAFFVDFGNNGSAYKALLYVSYNWDKVTEGDFNSWTTTFNSQPIDHIASYRDQTNLGNYGNRGYGMVVYDVTDFIVNGNNTFHLQKTTGNVAVYPSSLIVMTENPSASPKAVYILEEADLLSNQYNKHVEVVYISSFENIAKGDATLYVFAATAQAGEGDLIINGVLNEDVWSGTSNTFDTYQTTVDPGDISVQFKSTGSSILALHQMVVIENPNDSAINITSADADTDDGAWFNLNGQHLTGKPIHNGIYIHNGKKVFVK